MVGLSLRRDQIPVHIRGIVDIVPTPRPHRYDLDVCVISLFPFYQWDLLFADFLKDDSTLPEESPTMSLPASFPCLICGDDSCVLEIPTARKLVIDRAMRLQGLSPPTTTEWLLEIYPFRFADDLLHYAEDPHAIDGRLSACIFFGVRRSCRVAGGRCDRI